ncbi:MAG: hypothetical protein IKU10_05710 [Clostridia bacterium]|nr:hypothetical protein [Clostridia bacterium]
MKRAILFCLVILLSVGVVPTSLVAESTVSQTGQYGTEYMRYGDLNADETLSAADALIALQATVGKVQLQDPYPTVGDLDMDSKVGATDALLILQFVVGKITAFAVGEYYYFSTQTPPTTVEEYITRYDKSNSLNGAYEKDASADTGFSVDISSLASGTIYRLAAGVVKDVDHARLVYSMQGLINRDFGMDENHSVLVYITKETSDSTWFGEITADGTIMQMADAETGQLGLTMVRINTWDDFLQQFGKVIASCGMILWDGNVPATANAAATICGLDGYLPVLAQSPLHAQLTELGVSVKQTLVGCFQDGKRGQPLLDTALKSTGSAKNDTYLWMLERYFPRCTTSHIAYVQDGAITLQGYEAYPDHPVALSGGTNLLSNHDYYIARRCFFFDLAVNPNEAACDDPAQKAGQAAIGLDNDTMCKILQARYDRANGAFGQFLGFVPWWSKYTTHNGQGSIAPTWVEWLLAETISCYNLAKDADVANSTNHSVYYKYVLRQKTYENNRPKTQTKFDPNVSYYTLYLGDYDSSAWVKEYVFSMWMQRGGDKVRGQLPLMWCYNPNLSDRIPMVFDYLYEHKTEQDYFACGNSGAGYVMPSALVEGYTMPLIGKPRPASNGDATNLWANYCKGFYERFDLDITGFIINSSVTTVTPQVARCFNRFSPVGNMTNAVGTMLGLYEGTPYMYCQNGVDANTDASVLYDHLTNRMRGYNFAAYRTVLATPTNVRQIVTTFDSYAAEKGTVTQYVDPYTLFDLIRQSGQGMPIQ